MRDALAPKLVADFNHAVHVSKTPFRIGSFNIVMIHPDARIFF